MRINIVDHQRDISAKARTARIIGMDWEDIAQEINLHILTIEGKYDPRKSSPRTFIARVATNKIRDLIRRASAKKRGAYAIVSLDELIEGGFDIAYDPND